jgi:tetratricopeptide (TPR) repeat protein
MTDMAPGREGTRSLEARVERLLLRCAEWSQAGRHRKLLAEVEKALPATRRVPQLEARVLIWKALSLLAVGLPERALPAATISWQLEPSPQACHLVASALDCLGSGDDAEEMLRTGTELFPEAAHLQVQLAMMQAEQGRLPEALETVNCVEPSDDLPEDVRVFLFGLKANLLATLGRWSEADDLLSEGAESFPHSSLLADARTSIRQAWTRARAEEMLVESWLAGLEPLTGAAAEVDDALTRCGAILELDPLQLLAGHRLLRAFLAADPARLLAPEAWAAAVLLEVLALDGERPSAAAMARAVGASPSTVQTASRRLRAFTGALEPELARRSFAARTNPRLSECPPDTDRGLSSGRVVPFPGSRAGGGGR